MASMTQQVWDIIRKDIVIRRALEKGIVNMSALSSQIIERYKLDTTGDAVLTAIRRYKEDGPLQSKFDNALKIISDSTDIRTTSNIVRIAIEKNKRTQNILPAIFSKVDYEKGELLVVIQAEESIKVMINKKNLKKIIECIAKEYIINIDSDLALINIHLSNEAVNTPGIITVLSSELMVNNVNVEEVMSCVPEMIYFVDQKDMIRAYSILFELCNSIRMN